MEQKKVKILTLGCKVNRFESESMRLALANSGMEMVEDTADADVVLVNTCTVTHRSDRDARTLVRRAKRANPNAKIVAVGCYANVDPDALAQTGADLVLGNVDTSSVADFLHLSGVQLAQPGNAPLKPVPIVRFSGRKRGLLKVQDGCDASCSYCIVPKARGKSRSLPLADVIAGLADLKRGGHQEAILTGIHLGNWGRDLLLCVEESCADYEDCGKHPETGATLNIIATNRGNPPATGAMSNLSAAKNNDFEDCGKHPETGANLKIFTTSRDDYEVCGKHPATGDSGKVTNYEKPTGSGKSSLGLSDLIRVAAQSGIPRIRLSSLEPLEITNEIIDQIARSPNICPHLHIPLQSGCDRILKLMNRPYDAQTFVRRVEYAHSRIPGLALGFDVIVGFPGETDDDFNATLNLLKALKFSYLHVFPFSPRKGTPAFSMKGRVPEDVIDRRAEVLRTLSREKEREFLNSLVGTTLMVLPEGFEDIDGTRHLRGHCANYAVALMPYASETLPTVELRALITRLDGGRLFGMEVGQ